MYIILFTQINMNESACAIVTLIISLALVVYGFMLILRQKPRHENDLHKISDQMRGFAFLVLSQIVFVVGMSICYNRELFGLGRQLMGSF